MHCACFGAVGQQRKRYMKFTSTFPHSSLTKTAGNLAAVMQTTILACAAPCLLHTVFSAGERTGVRPVFTARYLDNREGADLETRKNIFGKRPRQDLSNDMR